MRLSDTFTFKLVLDNSHNAVEHNVLKTLKTLDKSFVQVCYTKSTTTRLHEHARECLGSNLFPTFVPIFYEIMTYKRDRSITTTVKNRRERKN